MIKIFLSTADHTGTVYTIRDFQERDFTVIAGDSNPEAIGRFFADGFYCLPRQDNPLYWNRVKEIVEDEGVGYYVPSGELECLQATRMREWFVKRNCVVVAPDYFTIWVAINKLRLYHYLTKIGVAVPDYWPVMNFEDYGMGLRILSGLLCIKPAVGSGTNGFVILREPKIEEVMKRSEFTILPPTVYGDTLKQKPFRALVLMEHVDATLLDSNVVCKNGKVLWQSVKTREKAVRGTIVRGEVVRNAYIEETNRRIVGNLGTTGLISVQYAGNIVLEINPRWSTSLHHAGVNEYLMSMQVWTDEEVEVGDIDDYVGTKMIRYWNVLTYKENEA